MATGDASVGSLKIPNPKLFKGTGSADDASDYESFANQLKAYLSFQNPRYCDLMNVAEHAPIGFPTDPSAQELATQLQNLLILLYSDKAATVLNHGDSACAARPV